MSATSNMNVNVNDPVRSGSNSDISYHSTRESKHTFDEADNRRPDTPPSSPDRINSGDPGINIPAWQNNLPEGQANAKSSPYRAYTVSKTLPTPEASVKADSDDEGLPQQQPKRNVDETSQRIIAARELKRGLTPIAQRRRDSLTTHSSSNTPYAHVHSRRLLSQAESSLQFNDAVADICTGGYPEIRMDRSSDHGNVLFSTLSVNSRPSFSGLTTTDTGTCKMKLKRTAERKYYNTLVEELQDPLTKQWYGYVHVGKNHEKLQSLVPTYRDASDSLSQIGLNMLDKLETGDHETLNYMPERFEPYSNNEINLLQEWCQKYGITLPKYKTRRVDDEHCNRTRITLEVKGELIKLSESAKGTNAKRKSKLLAASAMIDYLVEQGLFLREGNSPPSQSRSPKRSSFSYNGMTGASQIIKEVPQPQVEPKLPRDHSVGASSRSSRARGTATRGDGRSESSEPFSSRASSLHSSSRSPSRHRSVRASAKKHDYEQAAATLSQRMQLGEPIYYVMPASPFTEPDTRFNCSGHLSKHTNRNGVLGGAVVALRAVHVPNGGALEAQNQIQKMLYDWLDSRWREHSSKLDEQVRLPEDLMV